MNIPKCLFHLRPNAQWTLNGDDYSGLIWQDSVQTKPAFDELQDAWEEINAPIPPPPVSVSMRSLRLALIDAGLYQYVVAAINGIPDAQERLKAQVWWSSSPIVRRDNSYVTAIGATVGKTTQEIDQLFLSAQTLDLS